MVAGSDENAFDVVLIEEVEDAGEGGIVGKDFVDLSYGIVAVTGMVDPAAFDHEEESLVAVFGGRLKRCERGSCHLVKGWVDVVHVPPVNFVGDVGGGKEAQEGKLDARAEVQTIEAFAVADIAEAVLLGEVHDIAVIVAAGSVGGVGKEMAATSAEHEV